MSVFVLVHGAWHDGSSWDPVADRLRERGHEVHAPDLAFDDPAATWEARLAPALAIEHVDVVAGHSMGAGYAPIVAARRNARLVHVCPGFSALKATFVWPPTQDDGLTRWDPDQAREQLYAGIDGELADRLIARLRPMVAPPDRRPLKGHPDVPTTVVIGRHDALFDPAAETAKATQALGIDPIVLDTGHFPMLQDPDGLVAALIDNPPVREGA